MILPIVLLGATLLTALAAFARSYREAQGYLPLLMFLPMMPTLFLMVAPVRTQLWMLAVPFLGQNQLILRVLRAEPITAVEWAVSLGVGAAAGGDGLGRRGAPVSPRATRGQQLICSLTSCCVVRGSRRAGTRARRRWCAARRRSRCRSASRRWWSGSRSSRMGTSSPEVAVSVGAALSCNTDIAVGNVLGSNIFNVLFILGISALITPLVVHRRSSARRCRS